MAGKRCTPFTEGFRGVSATTHYLGPRTSVTITLFSILQIVPLEKSEDTVQAGLAHLFDLDVVNTQPDCSPQMRMLELPKV